MTTTFLTTDDLAPFATLDEAKAEAMIEDATAVALLAAPCLGGGEDYEELTEVQLAAVRAVLRGAILRWNEAGTGALVSQNAGPFGVTLDNRQQRRGMFWPTEIEQLQNICKGEGDGGAFSINTLPTSTAAIHSDICSIYFGGDCSCGAVLTGLFPLYEWYP